MRQFYQDSVIVRSLKLRWQANRGSRFTQRFATASPEGCGASHWGVLCNILWVQTPAICKMFPDFYRSTRQADFRRLNNH